MVEAITYAIERAIGHSEFEKNHRGENDVAERGSALLTVLPHTSSGP